MNFLIFLLIRHLLTLFFFVLGSSEISVSLNVHRLKHNINIAYNILKTYFTKIHINTSLAPEFNFVILKNE